MDKKKVNESTKETNQFYQFKFLKINIKLNTKLKKKKLKKKNFLFKI